MNLKKNSDEAARLEIYKYTAEDENGQMVFYYTYPEKSERVVKRVEDRLKKDVTVFDIFPGLLAMDEALSDAIWVTTRIQTPMYLPAGMNVTICDFGTILFGVAEEDDDS